jgi:hypothetical protein
MPSLARLCSCAAPLAVALGTTLVASDAHAGPNDNSASKPWSLNAGLGPAVTIPGGGLMGRFQFDMEYHFRGGDVGPALGFYVPVNFTAWSGGMNIGPVFLWDFRIYEKDNVKLYIGPIVATGYGFHSGWYGRYWGRGPGPAYIAHFWFLHFGAHFRVLWNDTIGMFARPAGFDVWAGTFGPRNPAALGVYSFIAGLTAAF